MKWKAINRAASCVAIDRPAISFWRIIDRISVIVRDNVIHRSTPKQSLPAAIGIHRTVGIAISSARIRPDQTNGFKTETLQYTSK
jgi:hypothetical protein